MVKLDDIRLRHWLNPRRDNGYMAYAPRAKTAIYDASSSGENEICSAINHATRLYFKLHIR